MFLRRRSREVYRVYTEDEYLNGAGWELTAAEDWPAAVQLAVGLAGEELPVAVEPGLEGADESPVAEEPAVGLEPGDAPIEEHIYGGFAHFDGGFDGGSVHSDGGFARSGRRDVRLRRLAGVAMLAGAVGTVSVVVVANISRAHRGAGRRPGSLVVARSSRVVSSPELAGSRAQSSGGAVMPRSMAPRSDVAQAERHRGRSGSQTSNKRLTNLRAGHAGSDTHTSKRPREIGSPPGPNPPGPNPPGPNPPGPDTQPAGAGVKRGSGVAIALDYSPGASVGGSAVAGSSVEMARSSRTSAATGHAEFGFER
jgi:hypothetical protein